MRTHGKQMISLLLALVMALALSACGGKTTPAASSGTTPAASTPAAGTPAASSPAAPAEPVKLTVGVPASNIVTTWEDNELTKWLEEQTGYELEFYYFSSTGSEYIAQLTAMISANEKLPDILLNLGLSNDQKVTLGEEGIFVDLSRYYDDEQFMSQFEWYNMNKKNQSAELWERAWTEGRQADGKTWYSAITILGDEPTDGPRYMVYINQKWLDKLGLAMPRTYDQLVTVLEAFRDKDPNGNGKADEIPMLGTENITRGEIDLWLINQYQYLHNNYSWVQGQDGKLYYPYVTDEYRQGLKDVRNLVVKGLLSPMTWTISQRTEMIQMVTPADNTAILGVWAGHMTLNNTENSPVTLEYQPLPPLEGAYAPLNRDVLTYRNYITADCEDPEAAFRLLMAAGTAEGARHMRYGTPGKDWEWVTDYTTGVKGLHMLDSTAFSGPTDSTYGFQVTFSTWAYAEGKDVPPDYIASADPPDKQDWVQQREKRNYDHMVEYLKVAEANNPKTLVYSLTFTPEELEARKDANSQIGSYIKRARAEFATGERDIYSDADWNAYLKDLKDIGLDILQETAQASWERIQASK